MAIDLKNESMYNLQMYDQLITLTANDLTKFKEYLQHGADKQLIGISYYQTKMDLCDRSLLVINKTLDDLEKEMRTRIKRKFPKIIGFKQLEALGASLQVEADAFKKLHGDKGKDVDGGKVIMPDFNISRERKI